MCSDVLQTCSIAFEFIVIWCILGIHFSSSVYNVTQAWREVGLGGGGELGCSLGFGVKNKGARAPSINPSLTR